ncbi:hypothetical protein Mgra_00001881 [Meloidogyne graminicola]|uniref:Uncharacterized protein n=1 Tax=Meloidogyne graminicola TaxID=189291 RepID=A0A8S9ZZX0_9BILA|nr:hypothetical protein Mgra_00001881 [Meloidogyne graminicola]
MSIGQFCKAGPAVAYGWIRPAFQGIGWSMAMVSLLIGIYYNVIVAWTLIYLWTILTGNSFQFSSCTNEFNTIYCSSSLEDLRCSKELNTSTLEAFYFNKTCSFINDINAKTLRDETFNNLSAVSPAEEFFERYVLEKTSTLSEFGGFNIKMVISLGIAWLFTTLVLVKGVEVMGKIAWFTGTTPYIIIIILFIRGITLDGAKVGLDFYLLKPDLSVIWLAETWKAAATQVCYSLAIGLGGLISLASFNDFNHNCFKDAFLITLADASTSVFGGTAVFSTLGFMSNQLNISINSVVQSGTGLAFIAYPEAMSRMPGLPWIWQFLFFLMILILGIASHFGLAEVMCTALYDQFPLLRKHKSWLVIIVCIICYLCGLIMCTKAGIFYFNLFDDYTASFSMMLLVLLELILVAHIYGLSNYVNDLQIMMGKSNNWLSKLYGPTGICIKIIWKIIAPILVVFILALYEQIKTSKRTYGKEKRLYIFPEWAIIFGWILSLISLIFIPLLIIINLIKFKKKGKNWKELFKLQNKWPSYSRKFKKNGK